MIDAVSAATGPYAGEALGQDDSFRLLSLEKGSGDDPVRIRLLNARLDAAPPYEAVSYFWGDASRPAEVHVLLDPPAAMPVTANCHAALRRLRRPDGDRTLWIDSICINQALVPERNHQLTLMGRIYQRAEQVAVYLGEGDHDSDEVMAWIRELDEPAHYGGGARFDLDKAEDLLRRLEEIDRTPGGGGGIVAAAATASQPEKENAPKLSQLSWLSRAEDFIRRFLSDGDTVTAGGPPAGQPEREKVQAFFQRPWFHRVWVLQEITMARSATVFCGKMEADWRAFICFYHWNTNHQQWAGTLPYPVRYRTDSPGASYLSRSYSQRLLELLRKTRACGATDPRDKLYAILPLLDWEHRQASRKAEELGDLLDDDTPSNENQQSAELARTEPDYDIAVDQVFTDLARQLLQTEGLDVLTYVTPRPLLQGLPSWVPDWSAVPPRWRGNPGKRRVVAQHDYPWAGFADKPRRAWGKINPDIADHSRFFAESEDSPAPSGGDDKPVVAAAAAQLQLRAARAGRVERLGDLCDIERGLFPIAQWRRLASDAERLETTTSTTAARGGGGGGGGVPWSLSPFLRTLAEDNVVYAYAIERAVELIESCTDDSDGALVADALEQNIASPGLGFGDMDADASEDGRRVPLVRLLERNLVHSLFRQACKIYDGCHMRRFFSTDTGYIGLAPETAAVGDLALVVEGATVPFIFRETGPSAPSAAAATTGHGSSGEDDGPVIVRLIGEAYIHGVMHGEIWQTRNGSSTVDTEVILVR